MRPNEEIGANRHVIASIRTEQGNCTCLTENRPEPGRY